jgi:hypothetical protein
MPSLIKGLDGCDIFQLRPLEETIKERYGISLETKKPLDVQELAKRIGQTPSLLLCAMLSTQPKCSLFGVNCLIEVIASIAENHPIYVGCLDYGTNQSRPFNFTLATDGFLKELFEPINLAFGERNHALVGFCFTPEHRTSKQTLREFSETTGSFELDLKIDLGISVFYDHSNEKTEQKKRKSEFIPIASVVVEFDGPAHLSDEQVRKDKLRDSMVQSSGCTVFRIQTPYNQQGQGAAQINRDRMSNVLEGQVRDIKNHFQNRLFSTVNATYLLKKLILKQPDNTDWFDAT